MSSENQVNSNLKTNFSPVTGDSLTSKVGSQEAYASGWDLIWGKKEPQKIPLEAWTSEEDRQEFKQREVENSFKCNIVEQHFLQEQLPDNVIGDEL